jgi:class 3 adenylate cyclase
MEKTIKHVNQMRATMKAIKENNILKMYVDETVLNFMGTREFESSLMVNETVEATVAFIDLCSFTTFSEKESPDKVVRLLNSYFDIMVKEIIDQNGYIDKFIGDAVMAVFRGEFHPDRAIDACLSIRKKLGMIPPTTEIPFSPMVSIGINSGEMISGNIGAENLRRLDYTVIGDAVNVAQRLQVEAKEQQIIIGQLCYEMVKESFNCSRVGEVILKHKTSPVTIYEVLD